MLLGGKLSDGIGFTGVDTDTTGVGKAVEVEVVAVFIVDVAWVTWLVEIVLSEEDNDDVDIDGVDIDKASLDGMVAVYGLFLV